MQHSRGRHADVQSKCTFDGTRPMRMLEKRNGCKAIPRTLFWQHTKQASREETPPHTTRKQSHVQLSRDSQGVHGVDDQPPGRNKLTRCGWKQPPVFCTAKAQLAAFGSTRRSVPTIQGWTGPSDGVHHAQ